MILADGKKGAVALGARDQEGWLSNDRADRATSLILAKFSLTRERARD
jgi:hypothetical protein